jgi:hypothetical protein
MNDQKNNIFLDSDKYFNRPENFQDMEEYANVIPVDIFGGYVPRGKDDRSNFVNNQAAIRKRFELGR